MRRHLESVLILGCLSLGLASAALGDQGVTVKITNDGTEDILVTVYDMNDGTGRVVLINTRINGFTSVPLSLTGDANGQARVSWTATSTDPAFKRCGHAVTAVGNDDAVNVHADSTCSA
jgi:hypothetical protein